MLMPCRVLFRVDPTRTEFRAVKNGKRISTATRHGTGRRLYFRMYRFVHMTARMRALQHAHRLSHCTHCQLYAHLFDAGLQYTDKKFGKSRLTRWFFLTAHKHFLVATRFRQVSVLPRLIITCLESNNESKPAVAATNTGRAASSPLHASVLRAFLLHQPSV